ncbi:hypothetical protein V8E55_007211, partial [Tylopilus felleus]
ITIWMVGYVSKSTLTSMDWVKQVQGIAITPISQGTALKTSCYFGRMHNPPIRSVGDWPDIWFSTYMRVTSEGSAQTGHPFSAVYDMRKQFSTNKSEMDAISVAKLNIRDIVLVEGRIRQHTTKQDQAQKGWMEWGVKFELVCVLLLHDR